MPADCHDLHVHTNHSKDVQDPEASFEGLAARGRELGISVGGKVVVSRQFPRYDHRRRRA